MMPAWALAVNITAGLFIYTDNSPPQPSAYYRMKY
jgi:hypothetical protein